MNQSTARTGRRPSTTGEEARAAGARDTLSPTSPPQTPPPGQEITTEPRDGRGPSPAPSETPPGDVVAPDPIFQIASGFMAAKHLFVANEVGLFAALAPGPRRLDERAAQTGVAQHRVRVLADAMVALGLLDPHADQYRNGPVAAA